MSVDLQAECLAGTVGIIAARRLASHCDLHEDEVAGSGTQCQ